MSISDMAAYAVSKGVKGMDGFFLGANTPLGFYTLYNEELSGLARLYILKGGPGCGKSTFMKRVAERVTAAGHECEPISCSSDPESLDAVIFPALGAGVVDGTSPHVTEPRYALAREQYVDLGEYVRKDALARSARQIEALTDGYRSHYARAYALLRSAGELHRLRQSEAVPAARGLLRRADGIVSRELGKPLPGSRQGAVKRRFLESLSGSGRVLRYERALSLCGRIYELDSAVSLAGPLLKRIGELAVRMGHDIILCPSPMDPDGPPDHVLIPGRGLGFLTVSPGKKLPSPAARRLLVDRALRSSELSEARRRIKEVGRAENAVLSLAAEALGAASALHAELEQLYVPHVDFSSVLERADLVSEEILTFE